MISQISKENNVNQFDNKFSINFNPLTQWKGKLSISVRQSDSIKKKFLFLLENVSKLSNTSHS